MSTFGGDPTQGDVVDELDAMSRKVRHTDFAIVVAPCSHCGKEQPEAYVNLGALFASSVKERNAEWALELAGIAARERARRAKRS